MIQVRDAHLTDLDTIARFQIAMALETEDMKLNPMTCEKGVRAIFENPHYGRYFLAEKDGQAVGSLLIQNEWSDWRNGVVWWIHSVYVVPEARGQGVYSMLYRHVQKLALEDTSIRGLRLYVDKRNTSAQKAYAKLGMSDDHYLLYEWMKHQK